MADSAIRHVLLMVKVHLQERHAAVGIAGIDQAKGRQKGAGSIFFQRQWIFEHRPIFKNQSEPPTFSDAPNLFGRRRIWPDYSKNGI